MTSSLALRNQLDKIRLLLRKDKESYLGFYQIMGFFPHDLRLYRQALRHKSTVLNADKRIPNNERLEFLGDAILDAIVGDIVYRHFEGRCEGFLTSTRSKVVQRETLNRLAVEIGLDKLVTYTKCGDAHNSYMYGNAFEAFIGAIYLDRGYHLCKKFVEEKIIKEHIDLDKMSRKEVNFKSKVLEWTQKHHLSLSFDIVEQTRDEHGNPIFQSVVLIGGIRTGTGCGYTKKEAQQNAARNTLRRLHRSRALKQKLLAVSKDSEQPISE